MRPLDLEVLLHNSAEEIAESVSVLQTSEPVVIEAPLNLDSNAAARLSEVIRRLPAPVVLVGDPASVCDIAVSVDVCLTSVADPPRPWVHAEVDDLARAVNRQPLAALGLVVLLRSTENLDTWSAVAEESTLYSMLLGSAAFKEWLARRGPSRHKRSGRPPVITEREGQVLRLTLDRPDARNAIDSEMRDALVEGLRVAAADPSLMLEMRGNGPSFSAGGDLEEFGSVGDPATAHAVHLTRHPGMALHSLAARATCYLHGACIGAGIEVPAFAARVVAEAGATFSLPEVSMGLVPGAGGTVSIPRRIGRQRAAWTILMGATIDTGTALSWGLVDDVVEDLGSAPRA